ncbi:M3 family oligoendopeptidase [Mangrovibacillus cuniculi]|uniref:M3 family oligoendopeptidase n=1 Tax=Mangrovibacillus cuniculi TaxID=2593652 RepID=A0A7S8CCM6_9BACI|nr:M3 family oligoendopeptidase [Mangrovibacillus cuniculi]QPC47472.1 M3 family oligoendopeptidase [Mangrovibacillus cuniculi]
MTTAYAEKWDLESLFAGGSESKELRTHLDQTKKYIDAFEERVANFTTPTSSEESSLIASLIEDAKVIMQFLTQGGAYIGCLQAQDMKDRKADALQSEVTGYRASYSTTFTTFQQTLAAAEDEVFAALLETEDLSLWNFILSEWRTQAKEKLSGPEEAMVNALAIDGYHGWGEMYDTLIGMLSLTVNVDGETKELSVGQANNLLSHPSPKVRKEVFEKLEQLWADNEELFARTLNHLGGFRLRLYEKRGWTEILKEPLAYNRMTEDTLNAMWGAIEKQKDAFVSYLNRKAEMLGETKMDWYNLDAPVSESTKTLSYQEGADFILKHFAKFGPEMASFSKTAFEKSWIEAEDRPGKRPGGFCTGFPLSEESRIFMTYSGSMSNVATLAHELGHAFHSYALRTVHPLNRRYAMNVAETASTFAEMIVADAAVKEATTKDEKIALLEDKLQRSVAFFMNIHARFLFEKRFYAERSKGYVSAQRLNELMEEAQREGYAGALETTHPHFWSSKLHFYITGVPFYNFPYTFGYLFSLSIYAKALEAGGNYEESYMALLRDTAVMNVEDLAMKHLGEDVTSEDFWSKGVALCVQDVEEFLELTK